MTEIQSIITQNNLSDDSASIMQKAFSGYFNQARELVKGARGIVVTSEEQTSLMKQARERRIELKNIRVEVEKTRKAMKEESLRTGKAIDGMANIIKFLIIPVEEHLQLQEDFVKIQEEKHKDKLEVERVSELSNYDIIADEYNLRDMSQEAYTQLLNNSKAAFEARQEAERKAEQEKIKVEKARIAEEKRIRDENERLRKEADERERKGVIERKKQAEKLAKIQEKQRKEREARLRAERELKEKQEAELKAREDTARKAQEEELAKLRAEKEARLAPDKEKMRTVYSKVREFKAYLQEAYEFRNTEVAEVMGLLIAGLDEQLQLIEKKIKSL